MGRIFFFTMAFLVCGILYWDNQTTKEALAHATNQLSAMTVELDQDRRQITDLTNEVTRSHGELAVLQARIAATPQSPPPQNWFQKRVEDARKLDR